MSAANRIVRVVLASSFRCTADAFALLTTSYKIPVTFQHGYHKVLTANQEIQLTNAKYRLIEALDGGSQGVIWRAVKEADGVEYALKSLRITPDAEINRHNAKHLKTEIAFLKQLPEPEKHYIIPCLDDGNWSQGTAQYPAFVMPYCPDSLSRYARASAGITLLRWAEQLAIALDWVHTHPLGTHPPIHRDVKPDNVLLTKTGDIRLIDFGILKTCSNTTAIAYRDKYYFAPEQRLPVQVGVREEEDLVAPKPASDLYCLGLILFKLSMGDPDYPKAQKELQHSSVRSNHLKQVKKKATGLLGVIGGLTSKEHAALQLTLQALFSGNSGSTLVFQPSPQRNQLPDIPLVATQLAQWIERLLAPKPEDRPTAAQSRIAFSALQCDLRPHITAIELAAYPAEVYAGKSLEFVVKVIGKGLPLHGRWLTLCQDQKPLAITPKSEKNKRSLDFYYRVHPLPEEEGKHEVTVFYRLDSKLHRVTAHYRVKCTLEQKWAVGGFDQRLRCVEKDPRPEWLAEISPPFLSKKPKDYLQWLDTLCKTYPHQQYLRRHLAGELWDLGQQEKALEQSLREEWLDHLESKVKTLTDGVRLLAQLKRLQAVYPENPGLKQRIQAIERAPIHASFRLRASFRLYWLFFRRGFRFGTPLVSLADSSFSYKTVFVNTKGERIREQEGNAHYFTVPLKALKKGDQPLEMVWIPAGSFQMGGDTYSDEKPIHPVQVAGFYISKMAITQAQYQAVMKNNPSYFEGANRPVESVSWQDAVQFYTRLRKLTGQPYRLPSEAEWEYACRSGSQTPFHFGETITTELANYDGNVCYAKELKGKYREETTEVGSFPPNAFGLYDMHGNVWEWCEDAWHDDYKGAPKDGSVWQGQGNHAHRVLRGGSWFYGPRIARSADRGGSVPGGRYDHGGFRLVLGFAGQ